MDPSAWQVPLWLRLGVSLQRLGWATDAVAHGQIEKNV